MGVLQGIISALVIWCLSLLAALDVPVSLSYWQSFVSALPLRECQQGMSHYESGSVAEAKPADAEPASAALLPRRFSLALWNGYKLQEQGWQAELHQLSARNDLLLLQEVVARDELQSVMQQSHTPLLQAFTLEGRATGVMTASRVAPVNLCGQRTIEPWIGVPKSLLMTEYPLQGGGTLMVVNLHGINFVWDLEVYQQQFSLIAALLAEYRGAVVVAGDFNSWRPARVEWLQQQLGALDLQEVIPMPDLRRRIFDEAIDQIWIRGLRIVSATSTQSYASDHNMVSVTLQLDCNVSGSVCP
jgi:endonuclease/exonuclease/phosphatase (EEP) superfamily protein YafD